MSHLKQILVFVFFYVSIPSFQSLMGQCVPSVTPFSNSTAFIFLPTLSPNVEEIAGKMYRRLYAYEGGSWMLTRFPISKSAFKLTDECPSGWVPPTVDDLINLLEFLGNKTLLTTPQYFNLQTNQTFASNTKKNPTNKNVSDPDAYIFYGIKFHSNGSSYLGEFSSFSENENENVKIFCIHSSKSINNMFDSSSTLHLIKPKGDLIKGIKYTFSVNNTNMVEFEWTVGNQTINSRQLNFIPMKAGYYEISVKARFFDGLILGACTSIRILDYFAPEINIKFAKNIKFSNLTVNRIIGSHMSAGSAPIAPKEDGGAYIIYSAQPDNKLYVKLISNEGIELDEFDLGKRGFPFDILAMDCGFMALFEEFPNSNKLFLIEMNTCSKSKPFEMILANYEDDMEVNDEKQEKRKSKGIAFAPSLSSSKIFGIEAIYNSKTGKIRLNKDKIATSLLHYNSFEDFEDNGTNDYSIDFIFQNSDDEFHFIWGKSHQLIKNFLHNGSLMYGESLNEFTHLNIRYLDDGRLVWTYVDQNFTLNYFYFNKSFEKATNSEYLRSLPSYKEEEYFYLIDQNDWNHYQTEPSDISNEEILSMEQIYEEDQKKELLKNNDTLLIEPVKEEALKKTVDTEKSIDSNGFDDNSLAGVIFLTLLMMALAHYLIKKI